MVNISENVKYGGCAAKIGPSELSGLLCGIEFPYDPNLLVGMEQPDDAGVYQISPELAIIQTVDFFTPMVKSPFLFGQIAAANSLSDVYAMGGKPITAMNIFCFPIKKLSKEIAREIIAGGVDTLKKANCILVGGHSVMDDEIKYGLAVTGTISPDRVRAKHTVHEGDLILLTKPIGTGVISTASLAEMAPSEAVSAIEKSMSELNRTAAEIMNRYNVHACTDVTGFGLAGSLYESMLYGEYKADIELEAIPFFNGVFELANMGMMPEGLYRNRNFYEKHIAFAGDRDSLTYQMLFDPQTSGGLLIFLSENEAEPMLQELKNSGVEHASIIGSVAKSDGHKISVLS